MQRIPFIFLPFDCFNAIQMQKNTIKQTCENFISNGDCIFQIPPKIQTDYVHAGRIIPNRKTLTKKIVSIFCFWSYKKTLGPVNILRYKPCDLVVFPYKFDWLLHRKNRTLDAACVQRLSGTNILDNSAIFCSACFHKALAPITKFPCGCLPMVRRQEKVPWNQE